MAMKRCPNCHSENIFFSKKKSVYVCEDCELHFEITHAQTEASASEQFVEETFWCKEFWEIAPVSLSKAYAQLYDYVKKNNIGCVLFLFRDVFELMIKIPVVVLFNGIHELVNESDGLHGIVHKDASLTNLYAYSMQMLSTGKWWECIRIATKIDPRLFRTRMEETHSSLYIQTLAYAKILYKNLHYQIPGQGKQNMVTWRNHALGHSCLADEPEANYIEIPYILKMFKEVAEKSLSYYRHVAFANSSRRILRGTRSDLVEQQVYIAYQVDLNQDTMSFIKMKSFVAGKETNYAFFDGYEKGKAYLLNYRDGKRYKDAPLSAYLRTKSQEATASASLMLSGAEDIYAENMESAAIRQLEQTLTTDAPIIPLDFLRRWVKDTVESFPKGYLLLTAQSGLGKSIFCDTIDQLDVHGFLMPSSEQIDDWEEWMDETAIRVWHFGNGYQSRKDVFIPGIRDSLLTLEPAVWSAQHYQAANTIVGSLMNQWSALLTCSEDLRRLAFADCLNKTLIEYQRRKGWNRLLLVLDGIDELSDTEELFTFLPDRKMLSEGIFVMLTSRTYEEISDRTELIQGLQAMQFCSHYQFTAEDCREIQEDRTVMEQHGNPEYRHAIFQYIENIKLDLKVDETVINPLKLAERFSYRFSSLSTYRRLCLMNPVFLHTESSDLFQIFWQQVQSKSPESYSKEMEALLITLCWAGEPLTLRELAYLSGERYVSFRMLGMLNDLQAFVQVRRVQRGNGYELSHSRWRESVQEMFPHSDLTFRERCSALLKELEESTTDENAAQLLDAAYAGEFWLLTHILSIYNTNSDALKENFWEYIRIGSVEKLLFQLLPNGVFQQALVDSYCGKDGGTLQQAIQNMEFDYSIAVGCFENDSKGERGYHCQKLSEAAGNDVFRQFALLYQSILEKNREELPNNARARLMHRIAVNLYVDRNTNHDEEFRYLAESIRLYEQGMEDMQGLIKSLQRMRYLYNQLQQHDQVIELCDKIILYLSAATDMEMRFYLCDAYLEKGIALDDVNKEDELAYYWKAYEIIEELCGIEENEKKLKEKRIIERNIGLTYGELGDLQNEAKYMQRSLHSLESIEKLPKHRSIADALIGTYKHLGRVNHLLQDDERSFRFYQAAYALQQKQSAGDVEQIELLELLVQVGREIPGTVLAEYEEHLQRLREEEKRMGDAYQELVAIINTLDRELIQAIPPELMQFLKENQNLEHNKSINPDIPLEDQNLMRETMVLISVLYLKYWEKSQTEKDQILGILQENDTRYISRLLRSACLPDQFDTTFQEAELLVMLQRGKEHHKVCTELYSILKRLPLSLSRQIPSNYLLLIKKERDIGYHYELPEDIRQLTCQPNTRIALTRLMSYTDYKLEAPGLE